MITFKEKGTEKYVKSGAFWIESNESEINTLWLKWVVHPKAYRYIDKKGFLVFTYKKEKWYVILKNKLMNLMNMS